jgi:thiol-disulfide isomerase/thioredoxin
LKNKNWLIDLSLIIIIVVMGVFVYLELSRTYDFFLMRSKPTATEAVAEFLEVDLSTAPPDVRLDDLTLADQAGLALLNLEGNPVALSEYAGKPMLINFWATWCPPCLEEMPLLQTYAERYAEEMTILAINAGENESLVRAYVAEHELELIILLDPSDSAIKHFRVYGFPTTLFYDKEGVLQSTHIGELNEELLVRNLIKIGIGE